MWQGSEERGILQLSMTCRTLMARSGLTGQLHYLEMMLIFNMKKRCPCISVVGNPTSNCHRQGPQDPGVHLPHRLLRLHRDRPVGGLDHLQDEEELGVPAGDEERDAQLWALLRNPLGRLPLLLPGHGQGAPDVSSEGNWKHFAFSTPFSSM